MTSPYREKSHLVYSFLRLKLQDGFERQPIRRIIFLRRPQPYLVETTQKAVTAEATTHQHNATRPRGKPRSG